MTKLLDEDFRAVGYTGAARDHPMNAMALVMLAAWNNIEVGQLTPAMRYHPNQAVKMAMAMEG